MWEGVGAGGAHRGLQLCSKGFARVGVQGFTVVSRCLLMSRLIQGHISNSKLLQILELLQ